MDIFTSEEKVEIVKIVKDFMENKSFTPFDVDKMQSDYDSLCYFNGSILPQIWGLTSGVCIGEYLCLYKNNPFNLSENTRFGIFTVTGCAVTFLTITSIVSLLTMGESSGWIDHAKNFKAITLNK